MPKQTQSLKSLTGSNNLKKRNRTNTRAEPEQMCVSFLFMLSGDFSLRKRFLKAKKAIRKAFEYQLENRCFSFVELISICPTNWGMTPVEAVQWAEDAMLPYYRLGDFKTPGSSSLDKQKSR
jgi:hypothetical protein